jgi:hypothetical protein
MALAADICRGENRYFLSPMVCLLCKVYAFVSAASHSVVVVAAFEFVSTHFAHDPIFSLQAIRRLSRRTRPFSNFCGRERSPIRNIGRPWFGRRRLSGWGVTTKKRRQRFCLNRRRKNDLLRRHCKRYAADLSENCRNKLSQPSREQVISFFQNSNSLVLCRQMMDGGEKFKRQ